MELTKDGTKCYYGEVAQRICNYILTHAIEHESHREGQRGMLLWDSWTEYPKPYVNGYFEEEGKWVAFDNTTGDCWVEDFDTEDQARLYAMNIVSDPDAIREGCTTNAEYDWED